MCMEDLIESVENLIEVVNEMNHKLDRIAVMQRSQEIDNDFSVGDRVQFVNVKDNGNIEVLEGTISDINEVDDGGNLYNRIETDDGRKFRCALKLNDTRLGTCVTARI